MADGASCLRHETDLPLVPDREHPHLILWDDETVQRDVSGLAEGNHEFTDVAVRSPPDQRVRGQVLDGRADGPSRRDGGVRFLACQESKCTLEMGQCPS